MSTPRVQGAREAMARHPRVAGRGARHMHTEDRHESLSSRLRSPDPRVREAAARAVAAVVGAGGGAGAGLRAGRGSRTGGGRAGPGRAGRRPVLRRTGSGRPGTGPARLPALGVARAGPAGGAGGAAAGLRAAGAVRGRDAGHRAHPRRSPAPRARAPYAPRCAGGAGAHRVRPEEVDYLSHGMTARLTLSGPGARDLAYLDVLDAAPGPRGYAQRLRSPDPGLREHPDDPPEQGPR